MSQDLPAASVIRGRPGAGRGLVLVGCAYLGVGCCFYLVVLAPLAWIARGFVPGESPMRGRDQGLLAVGGSLDAVMLLTLGLIVVGIGCLSLYEAHRLRRLRLVIDQRGVCGDDRPDDPVPWERIRHVAVTGGNPAFRRLLVDDGRLPERWWRPARLHPGRAQLTLLARRRRFLVNVPVDKLDVPAAEIVRSIRHHSGGRFPDRGDQRLG